MSSRYRKSLLIAAKCLIAGGLLYLVFRKVHLGDTVVTAPEGHAVVRLGLLTIARGISWGLLMLGALASVGSLLIVAVRWWMLLGLQRIRIPLWEALRLTFLGQFFNTVVPGVVGGDLVKAYYVAKHTPRKAAVLVSVFVDRVLGLTELVLLSGTMLLIVLSAGMETYDHIRLAVVSTLVVFGIVVVTLVFLLSRRFRRALHVQKLYQRLPIAHHIAAAGDAAVLYRRRLTYLLRAIAITFGAHIVWVGSIALLGASLGLAIPVHRYFLYVPLIYIIGAVPITPGGVGIVENFYLVFFTAPLVGDSQVFALALLARLVPIFWSLPGAVVAVTGPRLPKSADIRHELERAPDAGA